jgi:tRNA nucleotidyltransferase (CCA-adding enzyme)
MHMPPQANQAPIVAGSSRGQVERLWTVLDPARWPLPPEALPAGSALVGGAVRDGLLGRQADRVDLDLVVPDDAIALSRDLARRHGGSAVVLDGERSIARLVLRGWTVDLARRMGPDLESDLGRRDFSVNAMALTLADPQRLVDPHGGLEDLARGQLRALSEANLLDDPLRLLRGIRLASELGFAIEARTWAWICAHHDRLAGVAGERVLAELERIAATPTGEQGLARAWAAGLLATGVDAPALAALARCSPAWAHRCGLNAAEQAWALPLARLAAVLDEPELERLRASRRLRQRARGLRRWRRRLERCAQLRPQGSAPLAPPGPPLAPAAPDPVAPDPVAPDSMGPLRLTDLEEPERLALHRELEADLPALLLQLEADDAKAALARWRDPQDPLFHPRAPLDGEVLQRQLAVKPGPELGQLLQHLTLESAFGRLPAVRGQDPDERVLSSARQWLARLAQRCD